LAIKLIPGECTVLANKLSI